jgi:hypothetical protein
MEMKKVSLSFVSPGKWKLNDVYNFPVFAVRVKIIRGVTSVWELQNEAGKCVFGDAFESLDGIRAYFK